MISIIFFGSIVWYFYPAQFAAGTCVESRDDNYIWYIANYHNGKYTALGWQGKYWGNPVDIEKGLIERKNKDFLTDLYYTIVCPDLVI